MDRREAIRVIKELLADRDNDSRYPCVSSPRHYEALDLAIEALKEPIEIVHCKECKYWQEDEKFCDNEFGMYVHTRADDFCFQGKRKLNNPDDSLLTEDSEACKEQKSKLESDTISRQAAIEAMAPFDTNHELRDTLESLPPVEPPKKVVAQIKIDVEEIVERIKEEYEITEKPVCEDAIRCYEFLKERIGSETTDNAEEFEKWFERMVWHVQKCNEHDTEMRNVSEDAISKHDLWRIIEDNAYWITYNETSREKGMTLTGINQALNECPPVEPKVSEDCISRQQAIDGLCQNCEAFDCIVNGSYCGHDCTEVAILKNLPPVTPTKQQELGRLVDADKLLQETFIVDEEEWTTPEIRAILENAPPVEPKRPKGEWVSCSEPPKDRRNVFLAHGTNDFKSCCIGHYEQGMGWYEDRNFFAKPIYDCKYWCDIPELPNIGDNQFGMGVSAEI